MAAPQWTPRAQGGPPEFLPALDIPAPGPQRRLTVLLRWLLLLPQFVVLVLLGIAVFFTVIVGWFAALFTGRLPEGIARFLSGFLAYDTRVSAAAMLLVDHYPPFALYPAAPYPTRIELRPGPLNRLAVLFRIFLMIPAAIIRYLLEWGWSVLAVFVWLIVLVLGRMPRPVFEATAAVLRYGMRFEAYTLMLTSAYPKRLFGDPPQELPAGAAEPGAGEPGGQGRPFPPSATRPLVMSGAAQGLVAVFLVVGLAASILSDTTHGDDDHPRNRYSTPAPTVRRVDAG